MNNPAINARFLPLKEQPEHLASITNTLLSFLVLVEARKPTCKDMVTAHTGMNISRGEFYTRH
jgi:hemoglobin